MQTWRLLVLCLLMLMLYTVIMTQDMYINELEVNSAKIVGGATVLSSRPENQDSANTTGYRYGKHGKNTNKESNETKGQAKEDTKPVEVASIRPNLYQRRLQWHFGIFRRAVAAFLCIFSTFVHYFSLKTPFLHLSTRCLSLVTLFVFVLRALYFIRRSVYHRAYILLVGYITPLVLFTALFAFSKPRHWLDLHDFSPTAQTS
jgi:hypothetical protein